MKSIPRPWIAAALALALGDSAQAQPSVQVDLTGLKLQNGLNQSKTSAPATLSPATRYHYNVDAMIKGSSGILGLLYPNPIPLAQLLESLQSGSSEVLDGYACNPAGTHPVVLLDQPYSGQGSLGGINATISLNFKAGINASNHAYFEVTNVVINPAALVGSATITSGKATIERIACVPDADADGTLTIDDFIAFQTLFALGDEAADVNCDQQLSIDDFIEFQTLFAVGC
jgi:hypothetical protein